MKNDFGNTKTLLQDKLIMSAAISFLDTNNMNIMNLIFKCRIVFFAHEGSATTEIMSPIVSIFIPLSFYTEQRQFLESAFLMAGAVVAKQQW